MEKEKQPEQIKDISFKAIVNAQINDCRQVISRASTLEETNYATEFVKTLASLLKPHRDEEYNKAVKALKVECDEETGKLNAAQKKESHNIMKINRAYTRSLFELLIGLTHRSGLVIIGGDDGPDV